MKSNRFSSYYITKYIFHSKLGVFLTFFSLIQIMVIDLFQFVNFSFVNLLIIIDSCNVFSKSKVITLIQLRNSVYLFLNFNTFSFVIKIKILVNKTKLDDMIILLLGFNFAKVLPLIVEAGPIKMSVIKKNVLFSFKGLYFFYNIHYQF